MGRSHAAAGLWCLLGSTTCSVAAATSRPLSAVDEAIDERVVVPLEVEPDSTRAGLVLDCEGLGPEHSFWPRFRSALASGGPLEDHTVQLAHQKWREWQDMLDAGEAYVPMDTSTADEKAGIRVEGVVVSPPTCLEAMVQTQMLILLGTPPVYSADRFAGFLSCPIGFLLVHYVLFIYHKWRYAGQDQPGSPYFLSEGYESMLVSFHRLLLLPMYIHDHLESSTWGLTSFDMVVNMENVSENFIHASYDDFCRKYPVPPPRTPSWRSSWPQHARWEDRGFLEARLRRAAVDGRLRIALIGEHASSNLEHLSALSMALSDMLLGFQIEAAHFFTYVWALKGTDLGNAVERSLRLSWEAFWGAPLTASQGRNVAEAAEWTVNNAVKALMGYVTREPFLRSAPLLLCSEPLWLCVLLHAALRAAAPRAGRGLLTRASSGGRARCFLVDFHVFGLHEVPALWPLIRTFAAEASPVGAISATSRITAETMAYQAGVRAPYVPFLGLHAAAGIIYNSTMSRERSSGVLVFRCQHPAWLSFRRILSLLAGELQMPSNLYVMTGAASLSYADIAQYRAVVLLPHIPNAIRLAELYAMGVPILVPGEPFIHKFVWRFAGPLLGADDGLTAEDAVDPAAANIREEFELSPFEFQHDFFAFNKFHNDRRYWLQYTEWEQRPHLVRFQSARELVLLLASGWLTAEGAQSVSEHMLAEQAAMEREAASYWRAAVAAAL